MPRALLVGCDLGGTSVKLVRAQGNRVIETRQLPTPRSGTAANVVSSLAAAIAPLAADATAIGVAVPGFLDATRARVVYLSKLPALAGAPLKSGLQKLLGKPVVLDTDTNAGCVSEALSPTAKNFSRVLYISLGTGLGAAFCVAGEPVRVSHHTIGHVAHVPLAEYGPRYPGIPRGAAESLLSARGIVWQARRNGIRGVTSPEVLFLRAGSKTATDAAQARAVWRKTGALVGTLAALLAGLVAAELVIVGGGIAGASPWFLPAARRELKRRWPGYLGKPPQLWQSSHGRFSGALGIARLAGQQVAAER